MTSVPLWAVCLALAGIAPWCVRLFTNLAVRRIETRTRALVQAELRAGVQRTRESHLNSK